MKLKFILSLMLIGITSSAFGATMTHIADKQFLLGNDGKIYFRYLCGGVSLEADCEFHLHEHQLPRNVKAIEISATSSSRRPDEYPRITLIVIGNDGNIYRSTPRGVFETNFRVLPQGVLPLASGMPHGAPAID